MPELLGGMLRGSPTDPGVLQPALQRPVCDALLRALAASPDVRFQSARAFGQALSSAS